MILLPTRLARSLQDAYTILIKGFGKTGSSTSPRPGATVAGLKPASFAQKLWRFRVDPRVHESALIEPPQEAVRQEIARKPGALLAVHDWWHDFVETSARGRGEEDEPSASEFESIASGQPQTEEDQPWDGS
jgi:hypothetical protein